MKRLAVFLVLASSLALAGDFEVKELSTEQLAKLEAARDAVAKAQAALGAVEVDIKADFHHFVGWGDSNIVPAVCIGEYTDVELRGKYALITKRPSGMCGEIAYWGDPPDTIGITKALDITDVVSATIKAGDSAWKLDTDGWFVYVGDGWEPLEHNVH